MNAFLILSSLSVGFYLFLLVALHRDGRRRRRSIVTTQPMEFAGRPGIHLAMSNKRRTAGGLFSGQVHWRPVTKIHWTPANRTFQVNQNTPVIAAPQVNSAGQMKCG